jgi:hypothetical protein
VFVHFIRVRRRPQRSTRPCAPKVRHPNTIDLLPLTNLPLSVKRRAPRRFPRSTTARCAPILRHPNTIALLPLRRAASCLRSFNLAPPSAPGNGKDGAPARRTTDGLPPFRGGHTPSFSAGPGETHKPTPGVRLTPGDKLRANLPLRCATGRGEAAPSLHNHNAAEVAGPTASSHCWAAPIIAVRIRGSGTQC